MYVCLISDRSYLSLNFVVQACSESSFSCSLSVIKTSIFTGKDFKDRIKKLEIVLLFRTSAGVFIRSVLCFENKR